MRKTFYAPAPGQNRKKKNQERTGRWRASQRQKEIRKAVCPKWRSSKKPSSPNRSSSIKKYMKKLDPSQEELEARVSKDWSKVKKGYKKSQIKTSAVKYLQETQKEEKQVEELLKDWSRGGHGHFTIKKVDGLFRLLWENFNSLCILTEDRNLSKV